MAMGAGSVAEAHVRRTSRGARVRRALLVVLVVAFGLSVPGAVAPAGAATSPPLEFTVDSTATITYVQPNADWYRTPVVVLDTEALSGRYTLSHDPLVSAGGEYMRFTALSL